MTAPVRMRTTRLLLAGSLVAPMAFGLLFAGPSFFMAFPPAVISSSVSALAAILVLSLNRPGAAMVGIVVALLMFVLGVLDPTPGSMTRPSLGMQMSWGHAARFAGLIGFASGILEWRAGRGYPVGKLDRSAPFAAAVALGLALGIGGTTSAALTDPGFESAGMVVAVTPDTTLRIIEKGDRFTSVSGTVRAGQLVEIVVENQDSQIHSFTTTNGPSVDADNLGHKTTTILATAPDTPGTWTFVCKYHPEMKGSVQVQ